MKKIEEERRLEIVNNYLLFDSEIETEYDNITFLASKVCNTPISTITLVDDKRQWFKSKIGFEHVESPKNTSFCALSLTKDRKIVIIPNLMEDVEFSTIGRLNGIEKDGFYASITLVNEDEVPLGTLCVIDYESKNLDTDQIKALEILGKQVEDLFKTRLKNIQLNKNYDSLKEKYSELKQFSNIISHDIKTPLNNIVSLIALINEEKLDQETSSEYLDLLVASSHQLSNYVSNLLSYHQSETLIAIKNKFKLYEVVSEIQQILKMETDVKFDYDFNISLELTTDKIALSQIMLNLISNGIKYNHTVIPVIKINFEIENDKAIIKITDNGIGIEEQHFKTIFKNKTTLSRKDRYGNNGTGLGLTIVTNLAKKINFAITIESAIDFGTTFTLTQVD